MEHALELLQSLPRSCGGLTVGADKAYDTALFAKVARAVGVTPHAAAKSKGGAFEERTTRHPGYAVSQR